ncbi:MAG: CBS domain-containing protein [Syntrophales bacterium]|nr:CBS domain-containing protein [Syntrophales bacterium]MDD5233103.1 CBS domain-containing protein [Syntrophales bacterium]MDD5534012.1 CBS domain-containing protein [Syntrophales bacterium]HPL63981.1 CBS domain-containing protein [Syntrophales bacterium]
MPIGDICNRDVVVVRRKENIIEAARLMRSYHVGDVVVVEDMNGNVMPVGILTDRDIVVELIAKEVPLDSVFVEDIMTLNPVTARSDSGVWDTIQCMRTYGIRRIIVTDERGALIGILSIDDLLDLLAGELTDVIRIVNAEQKRERELRQ